MGLLIYRSIHVTSFSKMYSLILGKPLINIWTKCKKAKIYRSNKAKGRFFKAKYALQDSCETKCLANKQMFLLPDKVKNKGFVVDTGCLQVFKKVQLKNTHNGACNDRYYKCCYLESVV